MIGFGESKSPEAFRNACHRFVLTDILRPSIDPVPPAVAAESEARRCPPPPNPSWSSKSCQQPEVAKQFRLTALEQTATSRGGSPGRFWRISIETAAGLRLAPVRLQEALRFGQIYE